MHLAANVHLSHDQRRSVLPAGDTACSSAAYSLHDAVADMTAGRTDYALVLGSTTLMSPNMTLAFQRLHMLSPEGACKAFDAAGNGYMQSLALVLAGSAVQGCTLLMWVFCSGSGQPAIF